MKNYLKKIASNYCDRLMDKASKHNDRQKELVTEIGNDATTLTLYKLLELNKNGCIAKAVFIKSIFGL